MYPQCYFIAPCKKIILVFYTQRGMINSHNDEQTKWLDDSIASFFRTPAKLLFSKNWHFSDCHDNKISRYIYTAVIEWQLNNSRWKLFYIFRQKWQLPFPIHYNFFIRMTLDNGKERERVRLIITSTTMSHRMTFNYIFWTCLLLIFSHFVCMVYINIINIVDILLFLLMWHVCIIRRLYFKFVHIANFFSDV